MPNGLSQGLSKLTSHSAYTFPNTSFEEIRCRTRGAGVKAGACRDPKTGSLLKRTDPRRYKTFVKGYRNLYDYGRAIAEGRVSRAEHMRIYKVLRDQQRQAERHAGRPLTIINHNLDVPVLHFKLVDATAASSA